jgi:uncharacterized membrane protein
MSSAVLLSALAIALMTAATAMTRFAGYWVMARVPLTRRVRRMLEALPGSVVVATVLPIAAEGGPASMLAICAALAAMLVRRNELVAIGVGVSVAAAARAVGI